MTSINARRGMVLAASVALVVSGGLSAGPVLAESPAAPPLRERQVTLVTGDRVTVSRPDATTARIEPAAGREHITFGTSVVHGHLLVVPGDAGPLLRTGRLDRRLFDVTELLRLGYDDASRATVPVIVRYRSPAAAAGTKRALAAAGAKVGKELPAVRGVAVTARKSEVTGFWDTLKTTGPQVWLDGIRQRSLDVSVPQIGAPAAWQAGYTGAGMAVAVLDGGVDADHPDLKGKVTSQNFSAEPTAGDTDGHGTHVASTIAGTGAASGGKYKGVAPDATILNGKVCEPAGCYDSAVLAGMQWAAVDQKARVINMSLGGDDFPGLDPLEEAVNTLSAQTGALFVIAAGNNGADETVGSPGSADAALTVGAVDSADRTAEFSSRGPRSFDGAIKPDIAAPGVGIVAARAAHSEIGTPAADFPDTYQSLSGTSMATPHVAGAAALLAQEHPDWSGAQLKDILMASARPDVAGPFEQGAGRVDVARAITQTLTGAPASVSFGLLPWPHDKDTALTKTLTYHNPGPADVTAGLALTGATTVFRLSTTSVTIPAGGHADVTITADTTGDVAPGAYTGRIVATAGSARISTPVAVRKEDERYSVTLRTLGLDGELTPNSTTEIVGLAGDYYETPWGAGGEVTARVPKGRYVVASYIDTSAAVDGSQTAVLFQPVVTVAGDMTLTLDARKTVTAAQTVPEKNAVPYGAAISLSARVDGGPIRVGANAAGFGDMRIGLIDPAAAELPELTGSVSSVWAERDSGTRGVDSPYAYYVAERVPGPRLLSGNYRRGFSRHELGSQVQKIRGHADGQVASQYAEAVGDDGAAIGGGGVRAKAPGNRVTHFSTGAGVRWQLETVVGVKDDYGFLSGPFWRDAPHAYRPGDNGRQEWGAAPYGLVLNSSLPWIGRQKGTIDALIPQTGDGAGHIGFDNYARTSTRIYRENRLIGDYEGTATGAVGQPDEELTYRIEQTVSSAGYAGLATERAVAFTFRSARPATDGRVPLSVPAVRYQPPLDASNAVPAGPGTLRLWVQDQGGATITARTLTADMSFDDGRTWQALRIGPDGTAHVTYPRGKGFVSLRLGATDTHGAAVEQKVIRAYRLR